MAGSMTSRTGGAVGWLRPLVRSARWSGEEALASPRVSAIHRTFTHENLLKETACNGHRPAEIHVFVLWDPRNWAVQDALINQSSFEVVDRFIVDRGHHAWCLSIYGSEENVRAHGGCHGFGNPKVVVVRDMKPMYGVPQTIAAKQVLNTGIYALKSRLRKSAPFGQGWQAAHSSNNAEEAFLVLEPLKKSYSRPRLAPPSFQKLGDIFAELERHPCFLYVVLRSHDTVAKALRSPLSNADASLLDIDLLVNDFYFFKAVTAARSTHLTTMREVDDGPNVQNSVLAGRNGGGGAGGKWTFDVRFLGDDYYDHQWQCDMLRTRQRYYSRQGNWIYVQEPISYAMSLLYHFIVRKPTQDVSAERRAVIHRVLPGLRSERSLRARSHLQTYLSSHKYAVPRPHHTQAGHNLFDSLQSTALWGFHHNDCSYVTAETSYGRVIVKQDPVVWTTKCGLESDFPRFCDRPTGEAIAYEASSFLNISGVSLSIRRYGSSGIAKAISDVLARHNCSHHIARTPHPKDKMHLRYHGSPSRALFSLQLMERRLVAFVPTHAEAGSVVEVGVLDFLLDQCDRFSLFGYPKPGRWDPRFRPRWYNPHNWARRQLDDGRLVNVIFDNGKAMGGNGSASPSHAMFQAQHFWGAWCNFPRWLDPIGVTAFLAEQMGLPDSHISNVSLSGLLWRERSFNEHLQACRASRVHALDAGGCLNGSELLVSANGRYSLAFRPEAGLVISEALTGRTRGTKGAPPRPPLAGRLCMQLDGNLVLHGVDSRPLWATGTEVPFSNQPSSTAILANDGQLHIFNDEGATVYTQSVSGARRRSVPPATARR